MPNNLGLSYKSGLGSALRVGTISAYISYKPYTSQTFYQNYSPRISGVNSTILANEPFVFTYRILPELASGEGARGGPDTVYRSDPSNPKMHLVMYYQNVKNFYFNFIAVEQSPTIASAAVLIVPTKGSNTVESGVTYNYLLYKNEQPFTSNTAYRLYVNGVNIPITVNINTTSQYTPLSSTTSMTINNVMFGGSNFYGSINATLPMYVFNNSIFKVDSGLTSTYVDNLALELHRVDNYIHLLPTAYSVNPSNVVYYFPLYLKEGKDIRDYYNPSKKFDVRISFGNTNINLSQSDLITTGTSNYAAGQPTQSASIYKGPFNVWKKPYPPYEPYT